MAPAQRVGPYQVQSRLGMGGMAETFVAVRRGPAGFEQRVCLKRIRRDHEQDPEFVRQFLREARIAASLRHANIAQVLDFGSDGEDYYLALELIDGMDLRALLDRSGAGLPPDIVLFIAVELATALDFAHRAGGQSSTGAVVHRDVSPSNVLVSNEGEIKLTDFGIARAQSGPKHTATGIVKGKVPYLAPEYASSGHFDARCDLFSLGVLLYECAAGVRPYDGTTDLDTLDRARRGEHLPLHQVAAHVPDALTDAVECLISPDPALRFATTGELLEALAVLPGSPRARRDLARLVGDLRRTSMPTQEGETATPASTPSFQLARTEPMSSPDAEYPAPEVPLPRRRLGPLLALGAALLVATATLTIALTRPRTATNTPAPPTAALPERAAPVPETAPTKSSEPPAAPSLVVLGTTPNDRPQAATAGPVAATPARERRRRAELDVVVMPFGEVFIDGTLRGDSPLSLRLPPGSYEIRTNGPAAKKRARVTLAPGERKRLELQ